MRTAQVQNIKLVDDCASYILSFESFSRIVHKFGENSARKSAKLRCSSVHVFSGQNVCATRRSCPDAPSFHRRVAAVDCRAALRRLSTSTAPPLALRKRGNSKRVVALF